MGEARRGLDRLRITCPKCGHARAPERFGEMVMARRLQLRLSQENLARKAGISQPSMSRIEGKKEDPPVSVAARIAAALACTLDQLTPRQPPAEKR